LLGGLLGRPVLDQTGLKGNYDFDLAYTTDDAALAAAYRRVGQPEGNPDSNGVPLFSAIQPQLGLKLDATKGPVELIVVDHIGKTPTEN
jgi:uncharacterized protein (TIGR03435 family)